MSFDSDKMPERKGRDVSDAEVEALWELQELAHKWESADTRLKLRALFAEGVRTGGVYQ